MKIALFNFLLIKVTHGEGNKLNKTEKNYLEENKIPISTTCFPTYQCTLYLLCEGLEDRSEHQCQSGEVDGGGGCFEIKREKERNSTEMDQWGQ